MKRKQKTALTAVLLLAFLGAGSLLLATRHGVGLSPDAIVYVGAARNLAAGAGLTIPFGGAPGAANPLVSRAPLYAVLLAGSRLAGADPLAGARWINAFLFAANILLAGFLAFYLTRGGAGAAVLAAFLTLTSPVTLTIHAYAWSESLFILLGFGGLFLLAQYLAGGRFLWLLAAAAALALANLTRYAGLPFAAVGGLGLLLLGQRPRPRRLADAAVFAFFALLPLVLWFYRNAQAVGSAASREVVFHPVGREHIIQVVETLAAWLLIPAGFSGLIKMGVLAFLAGFVLSIAWLAYRQRPNGGAKGGPWYLSRLLAVFILVYPAFLLFSISFFDANTPLDDRILSPVFVAGFLLLVYCAPVWLAAGGRWLAYGVITVVLIFSAAYLLNAVSWVRTAQAEGLGFSGRAWQNTGIEQAISQLPAGALIYANAPGVVYILTERPSFPLPKKFSAVTRQVNDNYAQELAEVQVRLADDNSYLVYFSGIGAAVPGKEQELVEQLSLQTFATAEEGVIYVYAPDNQSQQ